MEFCEIVNTDHAHVRMQLGWELGKGHPIYQRLITVQAEYMNGISPLQKGACKS